MPNSFLAQLESDLAGLRREGTYRVCPEVHGSSRSSVVLDGAELVSLSSNDYLGLATHPEVLRAATEATIRCGFGSGSSRLIAGTYPEHRALEDQLAELVDLPAALLFPTGYQANIGAITAIAGPEDLIVADRAVHASLIDAFRLSRAKLAFFPHRNLDAARTHLQNLGHRARRRILVTESLFSMDGDAPALPELQNLACSYDAVFFVDEAHAIGTLGPMGRGLCSAQGVRPDVLVGTLGKAFGASGAFVAGSITLREYLINRARTFLFTTSLPIPVAAAAQAAARISASDEGSRLRSKLGALVAHARTLLDLPQDPISSPIIPIIVGDNQVAVDIATSLRASGFFVPAIRPPTVREGTARLRLSISALHTHDQLSRFRDALFPCLPKPLSLSLPPHPTPYFSTTSSPSSSPSSSHQAIPGLFLAGTDTSVGKTAVAQGLLHLLVSLGRKPVPYKPAETGASPAASDSLLLRHASARPDLPLDTICPFSFAEPVAPAIASSRAGLQLSLPLLVERASFAASFGRTLIVESAGGLLSPYAPQVSTADLASALAYPLLLIARNALGTVNQTALSLAEIRRRRLPLVGIVLVDTSPTICPSQASNSALIAETTGIHPLGVLPFIPDPTPTALAAALSAHVNLAPILSALG